MLPLKTIVEGLLFVSDSPLGLERLGELIGDAQIGPEQIREIIGELNEEYRNSERAFAIREVSGGYQLRTLMELATYALRLKREAPAKLSRQALETLAVIAYRQPVLRAEIDKIRGGDSGGVLRTLLDKDLIRISSRQEKLPGSPFLYSTTKKFLETFELKDLKELPTIEEMGKILPPSQPRLF